MRTHARTALALAALSAAALPPLACAGQSGPRASQEGSVSQRIHTATVTLEYSRPVARGRELFGALVPWDSVWNPGANRATTLETTEPLLVDERPLAAGRYSLWVTPRREGPWSVVFSRDWDVYHVPYPEGHDALQLEVEPEAGEHMETLAFYFPVVDGAEAVLRLHWGTTVLPLSLRRAGD